MLNSNLLSATFACGLATRYLEEGGHLILTGAKVRRLHELRRSDEGANYGFMVGNEATQGAKQRLFAIYTTNTRDFARCELATREEQREFRILKALGVKTGRGGFVVREEGVRDVRK